MENNNPPSDAEALKQEFDILAENMSKLEDEKKLLEDKGTKGFHRQYNQVERKIKKLNKQMVKKSKEVESAASGNFTKPSEAQL